MAVDAAVQMSHSMHMQETTYSARNKVKVSAKVSRVFKSLLAGGPEGQPKTIQCMDEGSESEAAMDEEDNVVATEAMAMLVNAEMDDGVEAVSREEVNLMVNPEERDENASLFESDSKISVMSTGRRAFLPGEADTIGRIFKENIKEGKCPTQQEVKERATDDAILDPLVQFYGAKRVVDRIRCFIRSQK